MRLFKFAIALSLLTFFALLATACGDDGHWDDDGTGTHTTPAAPAAPSEILIQNVVVHETDANGCAWDGPTCTPIFATGMELPDPYAVAKLVFHDGTHQGPAVSKTCQDMLKCTFKGFGFSLPDPTADTWDAVKELDIEVFDEDGLDDDRVGGIIISKQLLEAAYLDSRTKGYSTIKAPLDTRIVSVRLRIK